MELSIFKIFLVSLIIFNSLQISFCAPSKNQERSLADNYTVLTDDVKWFFRGVSNIAGTVEQMLPNVTANDVKTRTFSENTRVTFLLGLRHLLVGIREISMTFEQSFKTDHIKQLHQLKNATNFVNEIVSAMKMWFSQLRALVVHLVHLYNRYIPEVLFGKCIGNYLITQYPDRSYYEYPFIILSEMYASVMTTTTPSNNTESTTELPTFDGDLNMEQNEISHSDIDDYKTSSYGSKTSRQLASPSTEAPSNSESFFDFSSVLNENKDKIIENAVNQQSWQICLKLYTAESISRSLKSYFLGL
ncbi:hypothetical protein FF38_09937 [Lucilia cuprina]|uniref:Uncharacterized protein n=1 Tax=Lucilia cuprina TaxID=7375 RepID=A0A0L0CF71_LUCCU|nr:hypothetical protein FF38_09937 [Lucilia cuprina]